VIISRLYIDLGAANFKQGRLNEAKEIFSKSATNIEKIYKFINYDELKEESYLFDWFKAIICDKEVKLTDGPDVYY
jgi:hypothetical protein